MNILILQITLELQLLSIEKKIKVWKEINFKNIEVS